MFSHPKSIGGVPVKPPTVAVGVQLASRALVVRVNVWTNKSDYTL